MTSEQRLSNFELDCKVRDSEQNQELYELEIKSKNAKWQIENPNKINPYPRFPVHLGLMVGGIKYIN